MSNHFLKNIEINQYKCFNGLEAKGFKRINLISGKNNIGKTAFMEACFINLYAKDIKYLLIGMITVKAMREKRNIIGTIDAECARSFLEYIKDIKLSSNINKQFLAIKESNEIKAYFGTINDSVVNIAANKIEFDSYHHVGTFNFIESSGWSDAKLAQAYHFIQKQDKEAELNHLINAFDHSIFNFKVIGDKLQCCVAESGKREYRDIVEFGEGLRHFITLVCGICANRNGYLFVDEVDKGVHYSKLDKLSELVFSISKQCNCQIFATTHSQQMLESYARMCQKLQESDVSYTTLIKNTQNKVKAMTLDYEMLTDIIFDQGYKVK
jgi:AAA15 family ATPase/GTPase